MSVPDRPMVGIDDFGTGDLWDPVTRRDPHGFYAKVRRAGRPVLQVDPAGQRLWVVAGYDDVRAGLQHPAIGHEVGRHRPDGGGPPPPAGTEAAIAARELINLDPPDHTRLRGLVSRAFTARTVAGLESWIRELADRLVVRVAELGTFDAVTDLADPLPVGVICELVGVPETDRARFRSWSAVIVSGDDPGSIAADSFAAYLTALADHRRRDPADDLLSRLVALDTTGDDLENDELVAMLRLLLVAGQETTVYVVVNALRLLLTHPDQWLALREDPGLAGAVVEETLRFQGPVEMAPPRWTFEDVELGGGTIPAFERVGLSLWGADRDPKIFADPDTFDIHRADVGRHIAFGHGIHFCLGAALGRLEARILLETVARRLGDLELAGSPAEAEQLQPHDDRLLLRCGTDATR